MTRITQIQIRRGSASDWSSINPTLSQGELALENDTRKVKVGDGSTGWNSLRYICFDGGSIDSPPTTTTPAPFTPMAVLLTSGSSYSVPQGATTMKAWAVGAGGSQGAAVGNAGAVSYKTWSVTPGSSISYSLGANSTYYSRTNTTVTYNGVTISAQSGSGSDWSGNQAATHSGGDGGANGGLYVWDGTRSGGAVGGNGTMTSCGRIPATDVSGLFAAVQLAGGKTNETCDTTAAFGSGGFQAPGFKAGIGGGGSFDAMNGDQSTTAGGPSAVVFYFT